MYVRNILMNIDSLASMTFLIYFILLLITKKFNLIMSSQKIVINGYQIFNFLTKRLDYDKA